MTIVILRGVADGAAADATLWGSVVALAGFALVGMVVGGIAQTTIDESVRNKMEAELETVAGEAPAN